MTVLMMVVLCIIGFFSIKISHRSIETYGRKRSVGAYRIKYISKTVTIALLVFFSVLVINVSGVNYGQVSIFLSSLFAVIGVALFAQWSILSNITASLIIFFGFPYRVGDSIKVLDKDDDISGVIEEISLFHVLIRRGDELITYPNSLILQKGVVKKAPASSS